MKRLQDLYQAEINGSISWFFDGIVTAKLGDEHNGFIDEDQFDTIKEAVEGLEVMARKHYPDSELWKED